MKLKSFWILLSFLLPFLGYSQLSSPAPDNWQHLDKMKDGFLGVSADKMYRELLSGKKSQTVVVAVLDGGVDPKHEDLEEVMWNNPGEIPGNGKDDDNNGYVDDVYGWNFIGGKDGKNVHHDQLEITRIVAMYEKKFTNVDASKLSGKDKKEYNRYLEMKKIVEEKREESATNAALYGSILQAINSVIAAIGKEDLTKKDLEAFESNDAKLNRAAMVLSSMLEEGVTIKEIKEEVQSIYDHFNGQAEYNYNLDLEVRSIVGDNYNDSYERFYGNNDVKGPEAFHGTHVAGIIAAKRGNNIGMDGIADNVKIMAVRCVPDGDERDKDVANAIIYAVDNGASVINMSFGKGESWDKKAVDRAVKYAMKHDVLLVHAAGNSNQDNDDSSNFPNDKFEKAGLFKPKKAKNWVSVGALSWKKGEDSPANFSNYGKENVDLFAPGVDIYSTAPDNHYKHSDGTSMAAPVVAGVAAVIRSYYPDLTAEQVKDVLMKSVTKQNSRVKLPGGNGELVPFTDLCVTGGVVNAFEAVKLAGTVKGKKKNKNSKAGKGGSGKIDRNKV
jgi:subtilisin family serine protease